MGVVADVWNVLTGNKTNRENREHAREMAQMDFDRAQYAWNQQNAYNHPVQQMQRLKEAGLNPHLVYGKGAANIADPIRSTSGKPANAIAPKVSTDFGNKLLQGLNAKQTLATTENLQAQNAVIKQEKLLKAAQTLQATEQGFKSRAERKTIKANRQNIVDLTAAQTKQAEALTALNLSENERRNLANSANVRLTTQRIAESKQSIALSKDRQREIQAIIELTNDKSEYQKALNALAKNNIFPGDKIFFRELSKYIEDGNLILKDPTSNIRNKWDARKKTKYGKKYRGTRS